MIRPLLAKLAPLRALALILGFVQALIIARGFGPDIFGYFSMAMAALSLLVLILSAGLDQLLMRECAQCAPLGPWSSPTGSSLRRLILGWVAPGSILFCWGSGAALMSLVLVNPGALFPAWPALIGMSLIAPIILSRKFVESFMQGAKWPARSILASQIVQPAFLIGAAILIVFAGAQSLTALFYALGLACLFSLVVAIWMSAPILHRLNAAPHPAPAPRVKVLESGAMLAMVSLGFVASQQIDVLMVGMMAGPQAAAQTKIAIRVAELAGALRAISLIQYKPLLAEAYAQENFISLQKRVSQLGLFFALSGLPLIALLWIFAEHILTLFGPEFHSAVWVLRTYLIGIGILLACGPCNATLAVCSHENHASKAIWAGITANILGNIILIPSVGALGAAISNAAALALTGILSAHYLRRDLGIRTTLPHHLIRKFS